MFSSPIFTMTSLLSFILLLATIIMQLMEFSTYK